MEAALIGENLSLRNCLCSSAAMKSCRVIESLATSKGLF
jgi:hypothetical protein